VSLAWNASTAPPGARVVGYRVFRDGANLGQSAETRRDVPRLETARAFTFTVVAVDNRGRLSPPSRALTVSTNPPPPSTGSAHAFLLASTSQSFRDFQAHYRQIGAVHPTYFECNRSTALVQGRDDPQITQYAKLRQVEVYARFDCQSTPILHRILTEPGLRGAWLNTIVDTAVANGYDGINLDFEAGAASDRAAMTSFVAELSARLHAVGKKLAVDVSPKTVDDPKHPRSGFYDYPALAASADVVFVMAWGIHWSTSAPGPIADMPWVKQVVAYVNTLPNRHKYVMGAPLYGMDWVGNGGPANPATALEWSKVTALAQSVGAGLSFHPTAREAYFSYTDAQGRAHQVWALSAAAVAERVALFRANGYGVGFWRLGEEDQALWSHPLLAS
jgi:spore germination protein YaaH